MSAKLPKKVLYRPGDMLIQEKSQSQYLYIIQSGQVEIFRLKENGVRISLSIVGPGQYLGEMALFLDKPHSVSAVALSPVEAVQLSKESIDDQMKTVPPWLVALIRGLIDRLHQMNLRMIRHNIHDETLTETIDTIAQRSKKSEEDE